MSPAYVASPGGNAPVKLLQPGVNGYAFGSFDASFPTTKMSVSNVSLSSNLATVTVTVLEGKIPAVGSLITIIGTSTASGAFNVSNAVISVVSIDATTGIGTISFPLTHADVGSTADAGTAYVPVPEVGELLSAITGAANGASQAFALPDVSGPNDNGKTITMSVSYPSAPSTVVMTLQAAMVNLDSEYTSTGLSLNTTSPAIGSINLRLYRFIRVVCSGVSGGSAPSAVVRLGI